MKLAGSTYVLKSDLSSIQVKDLTIGDIVFNYDPVTKTQNLVTITKKELLGNAICANINDTLLPSGTGILLLRNEVHTIETDFFSHDILPFIQFNDALRTHIAITPNEAYSLGFSLYPYSLSWDKTGLAAYLAGAFDIGGSLYVTSTGIKEIDFNELKGVIVEQSIRTLVSILIGSRFSWPTLGKVEGNIIYSLIYDYLQVTPKVTKTEATILYPIFKKNLSITPVYEILGPTNGLLLSSGLVVGEKNG